MSESDNSMRSGSASFRPIGIGAWGNFMCGSCQQPSSQAENGMRKVHGLLTRVCKACKERIDKSERARLLAKVDA